MGLKKNSSVKKKTDITLRSVYDSMFNSYSHQGWWPLSGPARTKNTEQGKNVHMPKHHNGSPRDENDCFEIILGAILTQNTAWTNVEKAISQLHSKNIITPEKILSTKQSELGELIRSAGYYNQKSKRLGIISRFVQQHGFEELKSMETAELRTLLLGVDGIGPETADSILLYAFEKPSFVIDTYTKRIFSRVGICKQDIDYDGLQKMFMQEISSDVEIYKEYHALIVEHAKQHCRTKPLCEGCPISAMCAKKYL